VLGRALAGPAVGVATLTWRLPKTTGGLAVAYQYQVDGGGGWSALTPIDPASISPATDQRQPTVSAVVPCVISGSVSGCSYRLLAVNAVGTSPVSATRTAVLRHPGPPTDLAVVTSSVDLQTGLAHQSISWTAPVDVGGLGVADFVVLACATASGSPCTNSDPGWFQIADLPGNTADTSTVHACPSNGRCSYEVWARNSKGKGWAIAAGSPSVPQSLIATASTTTAGQIDLQWLSVVDVGAGFGNYVVFECDASQPCSSGSWTNVANDAQPWTRIDLPGTATTTSRQCGVVVACTYRVGYADSAGNIGGVTNAVTLVAQ